jgi:hypothetical protein
MGDAVDEDWLKQTIRRKARPIVNEMKQRSYSARLLPTIGMTTRKKYTGGGGAVRIGVVKNDADVFENISSFGLAAILEYGTPERFRSAKVGGIVTGKISTGKIEVGRGKKIKPFLRPAWDNNRTKLIKEVEKTINWKIERAAKK